ncbi:MAG TPA: PKD domain-containing protein, partial [Longimicrobium sp.]|nr:PKD domain-containing protein [Longimicrobium sp.]
SAYAVNRNGLVAGDAVDSASSGRLVRWRLSELNSRPSVTFPPQVLQAGETDSLALTAAGTDPEGDPLRYAWSLGDGTTINVNPTTAPSTVRRRYGDDGTYPVQVIVIDPSGAKDTATTTVAIHNIAPTAVFAAPSRTTEGSGYMLTVSGIADSYADLRAGIQVAFDCGTGSFSTPSAAERITCPAWPDNDSLTVAVRLYDKDGDTTVYSRSLIVQNAAPVARNSAGSPTTIQRRGTFTIQGSFTDAGLGDGPWKYRFTWGDGTFTEGYVNAQGAVPTAQHMYRGAGTYRPYLRITDKDGVSGTSGRLTVTVNP